ncbi:MULTISPECIES: hypothetical protein [Clostridium]|uniref:H-type lectin domain-containing protein n=1 Tax=Clostridium frigoriphilum TaxID=443253 RepID=A0ABU7UUI7_9CLOT|nr:hypothetical protein [Clostridium sp. DSM 17811]MBU3098755.1 hypothetical protein [Clostridium sp. DSM 17811]
MIDRLLQHGIGGGGESNTKGIQRGEYSVLSTDLTINITISPVDITKSIPKIFVCATGASTRANVTLFKCVLTSSTNLQITRYSNGATFTATIDWEVIEYNNVKSLQTGLLTLNTASTNIAISSVNMLKTDLFLSFTITSTYGLSEIMQIAMQLTSTTNLKFTGYGSMNYSIQWYAIEFN